MAYGLQTPPNLLRSTVDKTLFLFKGAGVSLRSDQPSNASLDLKMGGQLKFIKLPI